LSNTRFVAVISSCVVPAGAVGSGPEVAAGGGVGNTSRSASTPRIEPTITPANTSARGTSEKMKMDRIFKVLGLSAFF
jgi:hypothetical protein